MSFRKSWDKEKYEERAKLRAEGNLREDDDITSNNTNKIVKPAGDAYLESRKISLQLESKVGLVEVVQKVAGEDNDDSDNINLGPGYRCEICNWVAKDSSAYLTHLNSIEHNRMAGNTMKVKKASVNKVRERLAALKRKSGGNDSTSNNYIENDKRSKDVRKDKNSNDSGSSGNSDSDSGGLDPEMVAMMGFEYFGNKNKKRKR